MKRADDLNQMADRACGQRQRTPLHGPQHDGDGRRVTEKAESVERVIPAAAGTIFAFLADPANHPRLDGSGMVRAHTHGGSITGVDDEFGMQMRNGLAYRATSTVVEFEHDRRLAWRPYLYVFGRRVLGGQRWRYELREIDDASTLVRETYVWGDAITPRALRLGGFPKRMRTAMERSLENLSALTAGAPTD